jgi:phage tail-like protein
MTDDGAQQSNADWPLPKFSFEVKFDGIDVFHFQEVSGLDMESQTIEYRDGSNKPVAPLKMPGLKAFSHVTLKKGVFKGDIKFFDWFSEIKRNTIKRRRATISLLDETGAPTMVWTLSNAWPTKVSGTELKANGTEGAVESIVLEHEGLTLANA